MENLPDQAANAATLQSGLRLEVLRSDPEFTLYRGWRGSAAPMLALALTDPGASPQLIRRLTHELALASELRLPWSATPAEIVRHDGRAMLLLRDPGGTPLDRLLALELGGRLELTRFLDLAIGLAAAVAQVHRHGLLHGDIKPANVLVDEAGHVCLTGFGTATRLQGEHADEGREPALGGSLPYMAPEQTGRMNRTADTRSDLYSIGATLYEMLTGGPPFDSPDPVEMVHAHMARQPSPPSQRVEQLPTVVDGIVLKLLAKSPEDRYRTAAGLEVDLRTCLAAWRRRGQVESFHLGEHDLPDRLVIPRKLYGRDAEVDVLRTAFERIASSGTTELVLVAGYSGIGKTSIVRRFLDSIVLRRSLFAVGKFDQYKRDIPYSTLAQAFQGLVRQLLNKSDEELARWREQLREAVGSNGQLMINVIPELELIIGAQPPVLQVEIHTVQARFLLVLRNLLAVFAKPEAPLVLFLDDLQWLDDGTLQVLEHLSTEPAVRNLMLIGAYRDNEVDSTHPLMGTLTAIRSAGRVVTEIAPGPLQVSHLAQLSADALFTQARNTRQLAELLVQKTGGNPHFAVEFISELADGGLLALNAEKRVWQWDINRIRARGITDNVADLMSERLSRLLPSTREALGQMACLGTSADVQILALLQGTSEDQVLATLRDALAGGLISYGNRRLSFVHDRVQEAAYATIEPSSRPHLHQQIARTLEPLAAGSEVDERLFEIVHQYDRALPVLASPAERAHVAELCLLAAGRAKTSGAYASAQGYLTSGQALLWEDSWESQYQLTLDFELARAECEIVAGEMLHAEERLRRLEAHVESTGDRAAIVCLEVLLYFTTGRSDRAVEVSLQFLRTVGVNWNSRPTEAQVREEYEQMRNQLARRPLDTLFDMPAMREPDCIATMAVLTELFPAAYAVDRYLLELVLLRMTNLSLEHGHCDSSSVAYSALNMALGGHLDSRQTAYRLGELACCLVDRRGADRYKARVYSCFAAFTMPWIRHLKLCQPLMKHAFEVGSSMGDMAFAAYNERNLITHLLVSGVPLEQVQQEAEQAIAFAATISLGMPVERFFGQLELVRALRGIHVEEPAAEAWTTSELEQHPALAMMECYQRVFRLQRAYFESNIAAALEAAASVEPIRWAMRSSIEEAEYDFYAALSHAAAIDEGEGERRATHLQELQRHYARIDACARDCPDNFANRKALVGAEIARIEGRDLDAQQLYERAMDLARRHGFLQGQALACELAGSFYAAHGLHMAADAYLFEARSCYERWGSSIKVRQLDSGHPQLMARFQPTLTGGRGESPVVRLDVATVDKASQTLSSEMVLPSLLQKLMRLALEHAGAERGLLILLRNDEPWIEAEATTGSGRVEVAVRSVRVIASDLPQSALQYVLRTRERLILDDASAKGLDVEDEYVRRNRPRSILCVPIFRQTLVVGALYLENNLATCAFTPDRVAVLDFLASQAAIALENARLYSDLQRSEALLKEAQHLSLTGSFYWRVSLSTLECSDQTFRILDLDPEVTLTLDAVAQRVYPEDRQQWDELIQTARGPATDLDCRFRAQMPDLTVKHLHLVAHGSNAMSGEPEYFGAIQDVTQRHLAEEALGKVRSELAHVARVTTLGALTASIAHEVSQPLSGIVTNASTCLRMLGSHPPNVEGAMETVRRTIRDGHRASNVITRLRALFGNKGFTSEPVELNETTREIIAMSLHELQRGQVIVRTDLAPDLPAVTGDRVQLQQVILNLLLNAADAMSGVEGRARQLVVRTALDEGGWVRLSVQDAGVGFAPDVADRLFEAFYSTKRDGMGMGLSVSRSIIESHQGRIWATINDGPGATFAFALPSTLDGPAVAPAAESGGGSRGNQAAH